MTKRKRIARCLNNQHMLTFRKPLPKQRVIRVWKWRIKLPRKDK